MSVVTVKLNAAEVNAVPPRVPLPVPVIVNVRGAAVETAAAKMAQTTLRTEILNRYMNPLVAAFPSQLSQAYRSQAALDGVTVKAATEGTGQGARRELQFADVQSPAGGVKDQKAERDGDRQIH